MANMGGDPWRPRPWRPLAELSYNVLTMLRRLASERKVEKILGYMTSDIDTELRRRQG